MVANRKRLIREMTQIKNRFARWFAIYFPEYTDVFGDYEAQSSMLLLKKVCTPEASWNWEPRKSIKSGVMQSLGL